MVSTLTKPGVLLRVEGAVLLGLALLLYAQSGGSWLLFALLILAPDLSALGYLAGSRVGAMTYNLGHNYLPPAVLGGYGLLAQNPLAMQLALIWFAHIGGA